MQCRFENKKLNIHYSNNTIMKSKTKTKGMQVTQITRTVYRLLLTAYCLLLLTTKSSAAVSINVATSSNIVLSGNSVLELVATLMLTAAEDLVVSSRRQ